MHQFCVFVFSLTRSPLRFGDIKHWLSNMARSASQEEVYIWKVGAVPEGPNMGWAGLGWAWLGWAGLGWARLGWA